MRCPTSTADFKQRYSNTYIIASKGDKTFIMFLIDCNSEHITYYNVVGESWVGSKMERSPWNEVELVLKWPTLGVRNFDRGVVYIDRAAARQWSRGLSEKTLTTVDLLYHPRLWSAFGLPPLRIKTENGYYSGLFVDSVYYPIYPKWDGALKEVVEREVLARAVSPELWVMANPLQYNMVLLGYRTQVIGYVDSESSEVALLAQNSVLLPVLNEHNIVVSELKEITDV